MLSRPSSNAPVLRIHTPKSIARVLRAHLVRHNFRVLGFALLTAALATALWVVLYGVACWLILLAVSAEGESDVGIPRNFAAWFAGLALLSVAWVWLCSRLMPNERPRDKKPPWEVVSEFVLAIPRVTLSLFSTVSAWKRLTPAEYEQAAAFIHRLAAEGRVPLPSVPQELPDQRSRDHILLTLQLMQIIDLQKRDRDWFVTLNASRPKAFQFNRSGNGANNDLWY